MRREDIEIMAPVGSYEALMAAIQAGAGSVYFGVEHLNMRARSANNFTLEDIKEIAVSFYVELPIYLSAELGLRKYERARESC